MAPLSSTSRDGAPHVILLLQVSAIVIFSSLSTSPTHVSGYDFSDEICEGVTAPEYSQIATQNAVDNIMEDMREYPGYQLFCADGNKQDYYMHAQAGCASTTGCYACVEQAKDYLLQKCGTRLGARVNETNHRCYIRFENYHIDKCS